MSTKRTMSDYENAAKTSQSIAGMCRYFGLKPCGGNYKIMHKAIKEYDLDVRHFTGQGWNTDLHFKPTEAKPIKEILVADSTLQKNRIKNSVKMQKETTINIMESEIKMDELHGNENVAKKEELATLMNKTTFEIQDKKPPKTQKVSGMNENAKVIVVE